MNNKKIRILIADDHTLFRSGVINLLEGEKDIFIIGEAGTGQEMIIKYFELNPDIVLADISMPEIDGVNALKEIKKTDPSAKILFLSMFEGDEYIHYCYKADGMGLISKKVSKGELLFSIRTVYEGNKYFGANMTEEKIEEIIKTFESENVQIKDESAYLSPREKQVLKMIGEGLTSNEIAEKLFVSKRTIDTHRTNLIEKLKLKSLPELIKYAINFSQSEK